VLPFTNFHLSLICKVILIFQINVFKLQGVPTLTETLEGVICFLFPATAGEIISTFFLNAVFSRSTYCPKLCSNPGTKHCQSQVAQELSIASHKQNEIFPTLYLAIQCWVERKMLFCFRKW